MNHRFNIGDKIEARRNNGNIIQAEIELLHEKKASVFWYEENVYHFRKFFYHEMVKSKSINQQSRNHLLFSKKKAKNRFLDSFIIISIFLILMFCAVVFFIFVIGVYQNYENASKVYFI